MRIQLNRYCFNCNIGVNKGEIASIVGPNGAGKSTVMKSLFGLIGIRKGKVLLDGEDITNMPPQERVLKGMGFVPQTNNIFPSLSVQENLEMGAFIVRCSLKFLKILIRANDSRIAKSPVPTCGTGS